jgi:hypothetical protein
MIEYSLSSHKTACHRADKTVTTFFEQLKDGTTDPLEEYEALC